MWILILTLAFDSPASSASNASITSVEFKNKEACLKAGDFINKNPKRAYIIGAWCVPKE